MSLDAHIIRTVGPLHIDVELAIEPGSVVALLGPNGAGKTTVLRCLAGLLAVDDGHIRLDGATLDNAASDVFVRPERRPVGVVFQDYLLFPNLTALDNVAFGLRARGVASRQAKATATAWLERVGLTGHAHHRPTALSGGQAQRVAIARAMAIEPRLLLLDEPLAALDAATRADVRRDLRRYLDGFDGVRLLITHDPVDAYTLADSVVIIEAGRVVQHGTLAEVTARPRSRYVADLVGVNLLTCTASDGVLTSAGGGHIIPAEAVSGNAFVAVNPRAVALYLTPPSGSPRNVWACTVANIDHHADRVRVRVDGAVPLVAEITPDALATLSLRPGDHIWATVKATEITTYPT